MDLRTLLPELSSTLQDALESSGINTAQDVIYTSARQISSRLRLPPKIPSLREILELKANVAERVSAPAIRGDELFRRHSEDVERLHDPCLSGVQEVDALLNGFGHYGTIEIAGDKKSGRTGLVLNIVLRQLCNNPEQTVIWLDVGGEFSIERVADVLNLYDGPGSGTALDRFSIVTCFGIASAHQTLEEIRLQHSSEEPSKLRLFVIDPITPLFASELSATSSQGHAIMVTFMRMLNSLARTYRFTAIIINTVTQSPSNPYSAFPTMTTKPSLGPTFTFMTDNTLRLFHANNLVKRTMLQPEDEVLIAEVLRSHTTFSKTWCAFIMHKGISLHGYSLSLPAPAVYNIGRQFIVG